MWWRYVHSAEVGSISGLGNWFSSTLVKLVNDGRNKIAIICCLIVHFLLTCDVVFSLSWTYIVIYSLSVLCVASVLLCLMVST